MKKIEWLNSISNDRERVEILLNGENVLTLGL